MTATALQVKKDSSEKNIVMAPACPRDYAEVAEDNGLALGFSPYLNASHSHYSVAARDTHLLRHQTRPQSASFSFRTMTDSPAARKTVAWSASLAILQDLPFTLISWGGAAAPSVALGCVVGTLACWFFDPFVQRKFQTTLQKWKDEQVKNNSTEMLQNYYGQTSLRSDKKKAEATQAFFSSEIRSTTEAAVEQVACYLSFGANTVASLILTGALISSALALSSVLGGGISLAVSWNMKNAAQGELQALQIARNELLMHSSKMWKQTTVANEREYQSWRLELEEKEDLYQNARIAFIQATNRASERNKLMCMAPPTILLGYAALYPYRVGDSLANAPKILSAMPGVSQLIQLSSTMANCVNSLGALEEDIVFLRKMIIADPVDLTQRVKPTLITVMHDAVAVDTEQVLQDPSMFAIRGLWSICAANGAGKTTMLDALKERLGDSCFLLSVDKESSAEGENVSTGEACLARIAGAVKLDVRSLLVDEPFANTDQANTKKVKTLLHMFAKENSVVTTCTGSHRGRLCDLYDVKDLASALG